ncbi:D-serine dehydratase [Patella vulgata]|uniref:D-serine dehydratase n=1 Tax=Patella vulgata TaxID=6465 RepID=UPI0024A7C100|nr:D-serine dehydratase [Patella vulgata]XP_050418393.2 D-serine dehydratase [Patella vulgata]XP_050418394.2 D-serine dehydratase [Patella vulgata]XP_050418395.2 D-serine dehydratase [Patella vulgata]
MAETKIIDLPTPCLLVDLEIAKGNAQRMLNTATEMGVEIRPHMKTHKTLEGGVMMTGGRKSKICVSTLQEARFFSAGGFTDILYSIPITENKIKICQQTIKEVPDLKLMFDSRYGLQCIMNNPRPDGKPWSAIMEVDCGYARTGIEWDGEEILAIAQEADKCPTIHFMGLYVHCGDSYNAESVEEIHAIGDRTAERLVEVARRLKDRGINCETVGTGSTPCCNQPSKKMANLTEFHPGCYIFNDYGLTLNGSCARSEIAIKVATRVIDYKKSKNVVLVDCGFLALSLDGILEGGYGGMCSIQDHPELKMKAMDQELGKLTAADGQQLDFDKYPIGTLLYIYPFHACHTAAMHPVYYVHSGDTVVDKWTPTRGW